MDALIEEQLVSYFGEDGKYADYITLDDVIPVGLSADSSCFCAD